MHRTLVPWAAAATLDGHRRRRDPPGQRVLRRAGRPRCRAARRRGRHRPRRPLPGHRRRRRRARVSHRRRRRPQRPDRCRRLRLLPGARLGRLPAARRRPGRRPSAAQLMASLGTWIAARAAGSTVSGVAAMAWENLFFGVLCWGAWGVGLLARRLRDRAELLARLTTALDAERDAREHAVVAEERQRIARDMHDAVAHSISVMVLQLGAVRATLPPGTPQAEMLQGVERLGRESVRRAAQPGRHAAGHHHRDHGAAAVPRPRRGPRRRGPRRRPAGRAHRRRRPDRGAPRPGHLRLPGAAGGPDQRAAPCRHRRDERARAAGPPNASRSPSTTPRAPPLPRKRRARAHRDAGARRRVRRHPRGGRPTRRLHRACRLPLGTTSTPAIAQARA